MQRRRGSQAKYCSSSSMAGELAPAQCPAADKDVRLACNFDAPLYFVVVSPVSMAFDGVVTWNKEKIAAEILVLCMRHDSVCRKRPHIKFRDSSRRRRFRKYSGDWHSFRVPLSTMMTSSAQEQPSGRRWDLGALGDVLVPPPPTCSICTACKKRYGHGNACHEIANYEDSASCRVLSGF